MIMGHSVKQWLAWYDMKFHARLAQNAVDAMQVWTAAMLQQSGAAQPQALTRRRAQIVLSDSSDSEAEPEQPATVDPQVDQEMHDSDAERMACSSDSDIEVWW